MTDPNPPQPVDTRRYETGPGFVRARECPDCGHTCCGEACVCNCDAAHAEHELAVLREQFRSAAAELDQLRATIATMRTALEPLPATWRARSLNVIQHGALDDCANDLERVLRAAPVEQPPRSFDSMVAQLSRWLENYPDGSIVSNPTGDPGARFTWAIRQALHELRAPVEPAPKGPGDGG